MTLGEGAVGGQVSQFDAEQQGQSGVGKPLTAEHQRIRTPGVGELATARQREETKKKRVTSTSPVVSISPKLS